MPDLISADGLISLSPSSEQVRDTFDELCGSCAENDVSGFRRCPYRHCRQNFGGALFCYSYDEVEE